MSNRVVVIRFLSAVGAALAIAVAVIRTFDVSAEGIEFALSVASVGFGIAAWLQCQFATLAAQRDLFAQAAYRMAFATLLMATAAVVAP